MDAKLCLGKTGMWQPCQQILELVPSVRRRRQLQYRTATELVGWQAEHLLAGVVDLLNHGPRIECQDGITNGAHHFGETLFGQQALPTNLLAPAEVFDGSGYQ